MPHVSQDLGASGGERGDKQALCATAEKDRQTIMVWQLNNIVLTTIIKIIFQGLKFDA